MIKNILINFFLLNKILSQDIFENHCNVEEGFSWCDTSNKCLRVDDEPCLPITKECALCLVENYGIDTHCGDGCSMTTLQKIWKMQVF